MGSHTDMRGQGTTLYRSVIATTLLLVACQAFSVDREPFEVARRGYRDPDDPRNLFAAMYGGVYKRRDPALNPLSPDQLQYLKSLMRKRGLRDPYDPRNLF